MTNSGDPVHAEYVRRMEAAHGPEETRRILGETRWNSIVFPNVSFMSQFGQLRIVIRSRATGPRSTPPPSA